MDTYVVAYPFLSIELSAAPAVPQNSVIKETSTKRYARIFFV